MIAWRNGISVVVDCWIGLCIIMDTLINIRCLRSKARLYGKGASTIASLWYPGF